MACPVRASAMLPSILVVVLLFQVAAGSSRPLSTEERQQRPRADPTTTTAPAAVVHRGEPHLHRDAAEIGNGRVGVETPTEEDDVKGRTSTRARAEEGGAAAAVAALSATTTKTTARGKDGHADDGVGSRNGRPEAAAVQVLLRSRLARRFLAAGVVEGADSAARPSCRSNDVHIGCTPASEH